MRELASLMKTVRALDKTVDVLAKAAHTFGAILIFVMAFNVTYGVVMRYAFHAPSMVAMELTKILMIPGMILPTAYVQLTNRHLRVDFLANRFPKKLQTALFEVVVPIMALAVVYVLVWKTWNAAAFAYKMNETSYSTWREPLWPVKMTMPIGYGVLFLALVAQLCKGVASLFMTVTEKPEGSGQGPSAGRGG